MHGADQPFRLRAEKVLRVAIGAQVLREAPTADGTGVPDVPRALVAGCGRATAGRHPGGVPPRDGSDALYAKAARTHPVDTTDAAYGAGGPPLQT